MYNTPMTSTLFYVDIKQDTVRELEYTRQRALSVSPIFYQSRKEALMALKVRIEAKVQDGVDKLMSIERELAEGK